MSVLGILGGISAAASIIGGNKVRKAQKNQIKDQQRITKIKNKQAKRSFLNDFRRSQAQGVLSGIAALGGGYESSRIAGDVSSLRTQKNLALSEMEQLERLGANIAEAQMDIGRTTFAVNTINTATDFGSTEYGQSLLKKMGIG